MSKLDEKFNEFADKFLESVNTPRVPRTSLEKQVVTSRTFGFGPSYKGPEPEPVETFTPVICPDSETLTIVFSGVTACPCVSQGSTSFTITDLSELNAMFTLNRTAPNEWALISAGNYSGVSYLTGDCSGPTTSETGPFDILVSCVEGIFVVNVGSLFSGASVSPVANNNFCEPSFGASAYGGTATITVP